MEQNTLTHFKGLSLLTGAALGLTLVSSSLPARADDTPVGSLQKLHRIAALLQRDGYQEATPAELDQAAAAGLQRELLLKGIPSEPGLSLDSQLLHASEAAPQLCADGTLLEACVDGMAARLGDKYAAYLSPSAYAGLSQRMTGGQSAGPGLLIVKDHPNQPVEVLESEQGTAAAQAHLGEGDKVLSVDGHSTQDLAVDAVRSLLQGDDGTRVTVLVQRAGSSQSEEIQLARSPVDSRTVLAHVVKQGPRKIGYVRIRSFGSHTSEELRQALAMLQRHGAESLVLDLRNNGGGLVRAAVEVCSNFVPSGEKVVSVDSRAASEVRNALPGPRVSRPLVVLINQNSASAAEITAAAIRDKGLGKLVGAHSFGKGTVQRYVPLGDGSVLKLTTAHYHTPLGHEINGIGLDPDVRVPGPASSLGEPGDTQLTRALQLAVAGPGEVRTAALTSNSPLSP